MKNTKNKNAINVININKLSNEQILEESTSEEKVIEEKPTIEKSLFNEDKEDIKISDEVREQNNKYSLSKFEYDLFKDEDNIVFPLYRVKRISLPNKGENWKIFKNSQLVFLIEGIKFNNKEKEFLRSVNGINCILNFCKKNEIKTIKSIKDLIKNNKI